MDHHRFDTLTRVLAAPGTRRSLGRVLSLVFGLAALSHAGALEDAAAKKKKNDFAAEGPCGNGKVKANRCKRNRQCCTGYCHKGKRGKQGRCRCRKAGQPCREDRNCCPERTGNTCQDGSCRPAAPLPPPPPPPPPCAASCTGCCDGETCQPGTSAGACGTGGVACLSCRGSEPVCFRGGCVCGDVCASGCRFSSVQAAINAAAPGDTIRICAGTYQETSTIVIDRSLTLIGAGQGEDGTVLDGQDSHLVVRVDFHVTGVVLENLRVVNGGNSTHGGGIYNGGELTLIDCTVADCEADNGGGIFSADQRDVGGLTLIDSEIIDNSAQLGGGIYNDQGDARLIRSTVRDNQVPEDGLESGGGIYNGAAGTVTLEENSLVCDNRPTQCNGKDLPVPGCTDTCPA